MCLRCVIGTTLEETSSQYSNADWPTLNAVNFVKLNRHFYRCLMRFINCARVYCWLLFLENYYAGLDLQIVCL